MEGGIYVKNILFNKEGHLNKDTFHALKHSILDDDDLMDALSHISNCPKCAGTFANSFNDDELAEAPLGFEEEINMKLQLKKTSNLQFIFYCSKVIAAASIALIIVFSNGLNVAANTPIKESRIKPIDLSILNTVNDKFNSFSQNILTMEVFNNDK